ncbi:c-type cytochrome domain-containing protein [Terriglobus saanensis]|uniref:Cytochrome c domain-containing protein n=1 Tax=Terriglobus saanensis (strain ATCC BAA-1853 / DSM 23119 / SP1PR4) TaxID=401053 RepID=E8V2I7_TERSS|nr:c-type cytochrome domain-containing protein [Terriglobus saanensis]ADV82405.1 hypothetical protein AciPR4_1585 [Terriglobus saanensis SP1PR4]
MRSIIPTILFTVPLSLALKTSTVQAREDNTKAAFFTTRVKPILDANCARCHGGTNHRGGLNMDTRESLLKGGRDGASVAPGDPTSSLLIKLIRHEGPKDDPKNMPPKGEKLSDADIKIVEDWVKAGAAMPVAPVK